jgi:hypothetical protein
MNGLLFDAGEKHYSQYEQFSRIASPPAHWQKKAAASLDAAAFICL